jgi:hypothetical protein
VAAHGFSELVEVRHAPLRDTELAGETWPWYDRSALDDVTSCDLLIVDGPPGAVRPMSRYPALPLLAGKLNEHAIVVLDDCIRPDEQEIVERWCEEQPGWRVKVLDHEKVTTVLSR